MKRILWVAALLSLTLSAGAQTPAPPQPAPDSTATLQSAGKLIDLCKQAEELARKSRWYPAGKVRLELLERQAEQIQANAGDVDRYLQLFVLSRQLFWQQNPPTALGEKLRELDQASQALAWASGRKLELSVIGRSRAESGEELLGHLRAETVRVAQLTHSLSEEIRSAPARARQDVVALDEALRHFEAALQEGAHRKESWRSLNAARIHFLSSYLALPALDGRTAQLAEALQIVGDLGRRAYGSD